MVCGHGIQIENFSDKKVFYVLRKLNEEIELHKKMAKATPLSVIDGSYMVKIVVKCNVAGLFFFIS